MGTNTVGVKRLNGFKKFDQVHNEISLNHTADQLNRLFKEKYIRIKLAYLNGRLITKISKNFIKTLYTKP